MEGWGHLQHPKEPRGAGKAEAAEGNFSLCVLLPTCRMCVHVCKQLRMFRLEITKCLCKEGRGEASVLPQLAVTVVRNSNSHIISSAE